MDVSLILTGAMALLKPLLEKAGEKAAETIGEKLAEKTVQKTFWEKVKGLFIIEEEKQVIQAIENKTIAAPEEISLIEQKISEELNTNPAFSQEVKSSLNISPNNEFLATQKLQSIQRLQSQIKQLEVQMERAGIASAGDYINRVELQKEKLNHQTEELYKILNL